jgi:peroxiredoxin Q/BCP
VSEHIQFDLPNVGAGPERLVFEDVAAEHEFVLLLFQRDYHCTNCRSQVQDVAEAYTEFTERNTEVISIVPEPVERLRDWQDSYNLPFPLCADPDTDVSDAFDQPVRFGILGNLSDFLGRMPKAVVLDTRRTPAEIIHAHAGSSTWDRPEIEELLRIIDNNYT